VIGREGEAKSVTVALEAIKEAQPRVSSSSSISGQFTVSGEGVITDSQTGLEWYVGPDRDTTWNQAVSWVRTLSVDGGGWRMPKRAELKRLCQKRGFMKIKIDPVFSNFCKTTSTMIIVWSGETGDSSKAWYFRFSQFLSDEYWGDRGAPTTQARAFAVRSRR